MIIVSTSWLASSALDQRPLLKSVFVSVEDKMEATY